MCEPSHSIVQYDSDYDDDDDLPFSGQVDKRQRLEIFLGRIGEFTRKIGRWFHISRMGKGHSGATGFAKQQLIYLPDPVQYEGNWWVKGLSGFVLDNDPSCPRYYSFPEGFDSALEYYKRVCSGDIRVFRRFLEQSLNKTSSLMMYVNKFKLMLNKKGGGALDCDLKKVGVSRTSFLGISSSSYHRKNKKSIINLVMGYTRRRNLWLPEWADDLEFFK